jgi:hypothetical protein
VRAAAADLFLTFPASVGELGDSADIADFYHREAVMKASITISSCFFLFGTLCAVGIQAQTKPTPSTHQTCNGVIGPLTQSADGTTSEATFKNPPSPICSTSTSTAANVNTDCEGIAPHNETTIAIDPANPLHQLGSANDYQLFLSSGGFIVETIFSRAHVTFDGGKTWTTYPVPFHGYIATGDPAVSFDAGGTAYLSTLGFVFSQGRSPGETNPDVLVAHSTDGGKTWATVRVASGSGNAGGPGVFNDKSYSAAWGNGNAIVTWTVFNDGFKGSYISSPIFDSVTHDGGKTWSVPTEISGSASFCVGAQGGTACNQDQFSVPVVAADGSIYVAFENTANLITGRDQYLVVKVDRNTGARVAGPYKVADLVDGFTDYPINIDGRQTYQDSQFRTNSSGNITADPDNAQNLAVIWSDMRNSVLPAPSDPYQAITNSDIVISLSHDGGAGWATYVLSLGAGDQFMPWGVWGRNNLLRVGYFDRSSDPVNHKYGYSIATLDVSSGRPAVQSIQQSTALSDPTKGDRWFSARTPNPDFPHPTTFLGDCTGIAKSS